MKKTIVLISILLAGLHPAFSQEDNLSQFGIKAGLNLSDLYSDKDSKADMKTGLNLGIFAKMPLSGSLAIQPELYYTMKGASVTYNSLLLDGTADFSLSYLELPVLFVYKVTGMFNVHIGPYVSYLLNGKVKNDANINLFDFENNINMDNYNRIDAGLAAGAGIDIGSISIGARYYMGLTKVGKERTMLGTTYTIPNSKNSVINVYLAVSLN